MIPADKQDSPATCGCPNTGAPTVTVENRGAVRANCDHATGTIVVGVAHVTVEGWPISVCGTPVTPHLDGPHRSAVTANPARTVFVGVRASRQVGDAHRTEAGSGAKQNGEKVPPPFPADPDARAQAGLYDQEKARQFCDGFRKIMADWQNLTPDQRRQAIEKLANDFIVPAGGLPITVRSKRLSQGVVGGFDFRAWTLDLSSAYFNSTSFPEDRQKSLARTVLHEGGHSVDLVHGIQFVLGAAPEFGDPDKLAALTQVPRATATAILQQSQQRPLAPGSPEAAVGEKIADWYYGDRSADFALSQKFIERDPDSAAADALYKSAFPEQRAYATEALLDQTQC